MPIQALYVPAGTEFADRDEPTEEPMVSVMYGEVGVGFMAPAHFQLDSLDVAEGSEPEDFCEAAERLVQAKLLKRGDCFATRKQAEDAAIAMLRERAAQ